LPSLCFYGFSNGVLLFNKTSEQNHDDYHHGKYI
jgi:hypothetical protein